MIATAKVLSACHCLEMGRIYAVTNPTEMVDVKTAWDRLDEIFICKAMRIKLVAILISE